MRPVCIFKGSLLVALNPQMKFSHRQCCTFPRAAGCIFFAAALPDAEVFRGRGGGKIHLQRKIKRTAAECGFFWSTIGEKKNVKKKEG